MIKELNNKSLAFGVPGLIIQSIGIFTHPIIAIIGSILLIIGLAYYNKAKGYSGYLGLLGLLSFIGIIILIMLPDRHITAQIMPAKKVAKDVVLKILVLLVLFIVVPLVVYLLYKLTCGI